MIQGVSLSFSYSRKCVYVQGMVLFMVLGRIDYKEECELWTLNTLEFGVFLKIEYQPPIIFRIINIDMAPLPYSQDLLPVHAWSWPQILSDHAPSSLRSSELTSSWKLHIWLCVLSESFLSTLRIRLPVHIWSSATSSNSIRPQIRAGSSSFLRIRNLSYMNYMSFNNTPITS